MCVQELNLHGSRIQKIEGLSDLRCLEVVTLSFNSIEVLEGLSSLGRLQRLDVSFNQIISIGVRDGTPPTHTRQALPLGRRQFILLCALWLVTGGTGGLSYGPNFLALA